jgi:hypothetical protein
MNLPRLILATLLDRAADGARDIAELLRGENPDTGEPETDDAACPNCGTDHAGLLDILAGARKQPEDSPLIAAHTWEPRFASEVAEKALIALDGRNFGATPGTRALRVNRKKAVQHAGMLGAPVDAVTFLATDADSGEAHSVTVTPDSAIRVAFEVPDSASALGGEA